jgi:hypothetical protein
MREEPKVYPDSNPKAVLERIVHLYPDASTREFLLSIAKRGIRNHGEKNERD